MKKMLVSVVAVVAICVSSAAKADDFKAKCPLSGGPAKKDCSVDYKSGKVYFCCGGCAAKFTKDTAKYATKANQQLVATGQAKQEKCPLSGGKCNADTCAEVGGVKVCFCCNGCKGKVEKATGDDQAKLVFGDEAFAKGFKVSK